MIIDDPPPQLYTGQVKPHYSTMTIWSVLFRNRTFQSVNPACWFNGLIGVPVRSFIKFPTMRGGFGMSIDDIVLEQPMVGMEKF